MTEMNGYNDKAWPLEADDDDVKLLAKYLEDIANSTKQHIMS